MILKHPDLLRGEHAQDSETADKRGENHSTLPIYLHKSAFIRLSHGTDDQETNHYEPGHVKNHKEPSCGVVHVEPGDSDDERDAELHRRPHARDPETCDPKTQDPKAQNPKT